MSVRKLDDWLARYMQYTENSEPAKLYRLWVGICAISSVLQRKCWFKWGNEHIYPNLYVVLVGPPGGRKGTAIKQIKSAVQDLNISLASDCVTRAQLVREIAESKDNYLDAEGQVHEHRSLAVWAEEFSVFIGEKNPDMIVTLTDLFDCPKKWKYSTKGSGKDSADNSYLTLLSATTPSKLQSKLSQESVGGGLISRIIFVVGYGPEKLVPQPWESPEEVRLREDLEKDLESIHQLAGPFRFSDLALEKYTEWYMHPDAANAVDSDQFVGYNSRRALHLRKLCMILAVSKNSKRVITAEDFDEALAILTTTEQEMPNAFFGIGRGRHAETLADIMRTFEQNPTMTWPALVDRFKMDADAYELSNMLGLLETSGRIKAERSNTDKVRYQLTKKAAEKIAAKQLDSTVFRYLQEDFL